MRTMPISLTSGDSVTTTRSHRLRSRRPFPSSSTWRQRPTRARLGARVQAGEVGARQAPVEAVYRRLHVVWGRAVRSDAVGLGIRSNAPPPDLLTVGMVDIAPTTPRLHDGKSAPSAVSSAADATVSAVVPLPEPVDEVPVKRVRARTKSGRVAAIVDPDEKKPRRPRGRSTTNATDG